jgi:hypothetical protein
VPSGGAEMGEDAPRIWFQTPDKRVLPGARIAPKWRARVSEPVTGWTAGK